MTVHPRLVRSIPFWTLIAGSAAAIGGGAYLLVDKLGTMEEALLAGTATGVEVYVGQVWAVVGGILIGAGVLGLALALTVASARSLVASPAPTGDTGARRDDEEVVTSDDAESNAVNSDAEGSDDAPARIPAELASVSDSDAPAHTQPVRR